MKGKILTSKALAKKIAAFALLNGHLLLSAASLTDMALFTALAWALFAALLYERFCLAILFLILGVFMRPEGMLLAVGLAVFGAIRLGRRDPGDRQAPAIQSSAETLGGRPHRRGGFGRVQRNPFQCPRRRRDPGAHPAERHRLEAARTLRCRALRAGRQQR